MGRGAGLKEGGKEGAVLGKGKWKMFIHVEAFGGLPVVWEVALVNALEEALVCRFLDLGDELEEEEGIKVGRNGSVDEGKRTCIIA